MFDTANFASARDVAAALGAIKLTAPDFKTLAAISKVCRDDFLKAISACVAAQDPDGAFRQFLDRMIEITSPATVAKLTWMGLAPQIETLAVIGSRAPVRFLSALVVATDSSNPRRDEAKAVVTSMLSATTPPPSAPTPADKPANEPPHAAGGESRNVDAGRRSTHVYGANYALCFNAVPGRNNEPGIMVDAAASSGPRAYDWKNAIHLMLDAREVACIFAVFRRWRPSVEFTAHGAKNDKGFVLERQGTNFFAKVSAKGAGVRAVKILPQDAHKVAILFLEQLLLAYPNVPETEVIALVRSINSQAAGPRVAAGGGQ